MSPNRLQGREVLILAGVDEGRICPFNVKIRLPFVPGILAERTLGHGQVFRSPWRCPTSAPLEVGGFNGLLTARGSELGQSHWLSKMPGHDDAKV